MSDKTSSRGVTKRKFSRPGTDVNPAALSAAELRALRLRAQGLDPRWPGRGLPAGVQALVGVNAQLVSAMALALRARVTGLTWETLEARRVTRRDLVRTWCMRGTLHLLRADELDELLAAIAPSSIRGAWRWLERRAGLSGTRAQQAVEASCAVLKRAGPLPRRALMTAVSAEVGFDTQAAAAGLMFLNGMLGRICFGPMDGAEPTYAALDDWLGRPVTLPATPDHAALARRYLRGYGPATPRDFAAWWGLSLGEAKAAWAALGDELVERQVEGQPVWMLTQDAKALAGLATAAPSARLLPAFDTYLLGYAAREYAVPKPYQKEIFHGGQVVPTVILNGLAAGTWHYEQRGGQMRLAVTPFAPLSAGERELIAAEAEDIARFYDARAALSFTAS